MKVRQRFSLLPLSHFFRCECIRMLGILLLFYDYKFTPLLRIELRSHYSFDNGYFQLNWAYNYYYYLATFTEVGGGTLVGVGT